MVSQTQMRRVRLFSAPQCGQTKTFGTGKLGVGFGMGDLLECFGHGVASVETFVWRLDKVTVGAEPNVGEAASDIGVEGNVRVGGATEVAGQSHTVNKGWIHGDTFLRYSPAA